MIRAVLFDLDGTLTDWDAAIEAALVQVLPDVPALGRPRLRERFAGALAGWAFEWRDGVVVDRKQWMLLRDPEPPWRTTLPETPAPEVAAIAARFRSLLRPVLYDDAIPALDALAGRYALGLLSNNPNAERELEALSLRGRFQWVRGSYRGGKPEARAFLTACEGVGAAPGDSVYVGDSPTRDVEGALGAGLRAVWVDRYGDAYRPQPGAVRVESLAELEMALRALG